MKRKSVIGFDSWTEGARNFSRLVPALKAVGIDLKLIHVGSWGHDQARPAHEVIDGLPVFDIAYYGNISLLELLKAENPAAIIFLSTQAFVHRAVNRYASILDIPTLHLSHGLIAVQAVETGNPDKISFVPQLKLVTGRMFKNFTKLLPVYVKSLIVTRAASTEWLRIIRDVSFKVFGLYTKVAAKDSRTDYAAVYTSADFDEARIKYHVNRENIRVVGNPDLIKFGLVANDFGGFCSTASDMKTIMYIDHGGSTCALTFASPSAFLDYLEQSNNEIIKQGYRLIVKMHPSQESTSTPELAKNRGIELSSNATFLADLRSCCAAIVGPSTASLIPALMGLPLLLAQHGPFATQEYGKALLTYPRAILLKNITNLRDSLAEENESLDPAAIFTWIGENSGPLPAEKMPERVASIIVEMIKGKARRELI